MWNITCMSDSWIVKILANKIIRWTSSKFHFYYLSFVQVQIDKHFKKKCIFTWASGNLSPLNQLSDLNASLTMLSSVELFCSTKLNKNIKPCLRQTNAIPGQENKSVWKICLVSETDQLQAIDSMSLILDHGLVNNYLCSLSYKAVHTNLKGGYWRVPQEDLHHLLSHRFPVNLLKCCTEFYRSGETQFFTISKTFIYAI